MSVKKNLVKYMQNRSLTVKELAHAASISEPTLKKLRTQDDSNPTLDVIMRISNALDISVNDLIEDHSSYPTVYQDKLDHSKPLDNEFIFIFVRDTFNFSKGAHTLFKRYYTNNTEFLTKYILDIDGNIYKRIHGLLFQNEHEEEIFVQEDSIFAYITKELYEASNV